MTILTKNVERPEFIENLLFRSNKDISVDKFDQNYVPHP